jgi:glycosyltransferase involved in cell wall biosynthesis
VRMLILSRYGALPAPSRYRMYQFLSEISASGIEYDISPLFSDDFIRYQYTSKRNSKLMGAISYLKRLGLSKVSANYNLIWLEKEIFPWLPFFFEYFVFLKNTPFVVDYDDAVFHTYDLNNSFYSKYLMRHKIGKLMEYSAATVVGNTYLKDYAVKSRARNVVMIPTVVDLKKYNLKSRKTSIFTIGWIGSPANSHHLEIIADALRYLNTKIQFKLVIIGGWRIPSMQDMSFIEYLPWEESSEVDQLSSFDIGIMPLKDGFWEKGKCGLKLIQYMAAGLPTVCSPVGVNSEICLDGITGFLAKDTAEWIDYITELAKNLDLRKQMGNLGRDRVRQFYSIDSVKNILIETLKANAKF